MSLLGFETYLVSVRMPKDDNDNNNDDNYDNKNNDNNKASKLTEKLVQAKEILQQRSFSRCSAMHITQITILTRFTWFLLHSIYLCPHTRDGVCVKFLHHKT